MAIHFNTDPSLRSDKSLLALADERGYGDFHVKIDPVTGLHAIIAIHSTTLGPAIGGCRCAHYERFEDAVVDALNLGRGMSLKAAIHNLPHGGGKAVLIKPKDGISDRAAYFKALGRFVDQCGGRYITAVDSGTTPADMDAVVQETPYVLCNTFDDGSSGDPSPATATGVLRALQAAIKFKLNRDDMTGLHIAVQGLGNVGMSLAQQIHELGGKLSVCDVNPANTDAAAKNFGATVVEPTEIHQVECNAFAPCAFGGVLNDSTIPELRTQIVCGAANNQFAKPEHSELLAQRDILFVPDFVANGGGLIAVSVVYAKQPLDNITRLVDGIYDTTLDILTQAQSKNKLTDRMAIEIAEGRIQEVSAVKKRAIEPLTEDAV